MTLRLAVSARGAVLVALARAAPFIVRLPHGPHGPHGVCADGREAIQGPQLTGL